MHTFVCKPHQPEPGKCKVIQYFQQILCALHGGLCNFARFSITCRVAPKDSIIAVNNNSVPHASLVPRPSSLMPPEKKVRERKAWYNLSRD